MNVNKLIGYHLLKRHSGIDVRKILKFAKE